MSNVTDMVNINVPGCEWGKPDMRYVEQGENASYQGSVREVISRHRNQP